MSLILLETHGEVWRSRVEGHFILGVHPIEGVRKGLPEAMAQAIVDHCVMAGEDVRAFGHRLMAEIAALAAAYPEPQPTQEFTLPEGSEFLEVVDASEIANRVVAVEPRRARVPRKSK